MPVPKYHELFIPVLQTIKKLGGSASIAELNEEVTKNLNLTDEEISKPHDARQTELEYQLAWARSYLRFLAYFTTRSVVFGQLQQRAKKLM